MRRLVVLVTLSALACEAAPARTKSAIAGARKPVGPYSSGVGYGELVFVAGHVGTDPATGELVPGGTAAEARRAMDNIAVVLEGAGLGFGDVVKTTIFLADMADFAAVNEVYAGYFAADAILP